MKKKGLWKVVGGLLGPLVLLTTFPVPANAYPRPGLTERISMAPEGAPAGRRYNFAPAISADGRHVAFWSISSLVPGDTNGNRDVFVYDRATGNTERVSVASDGAEANADVSGSDFPSISADGRHVAFSSTASNLVAGDTNGTLDVFVHDRTTRTTERISVASDGAEANSHSYTPAIDPDGGHIAFTSIASNLVTGDTNQGPLSWDIFVHDRATGVTERVSVASDGAEANAQSFTPAISAGGDHVAFRSAASNLVPADTNGVFDVFVHDRATAITERISVTSDGTEGNSLSYIPAISADGRHVTFSSTASNLVAGDTNDQWDVFVHDRAMGITERVSVASDGTEANSQSQSFFFAMSGDGGQVAFESLASNLVPGDTNGAADAFVRERGGSLGILGTPSVLEVPGGVGVSGRATISGATLSEATDPDDDGTGVGPLGAAGAELTGAALIYRPEQEDLFLRLDLASLPPAATGPLGVLYGADLRVGETRYEVRALRAAATAEPRGAPHVALYRCDPVCAEHAPLTGSFGTTGEQVRVSVPLSAIAAPEGTQLTDLRAFTAAGEATPGALVPLDEVALSSSVIPASRVELGIADASTPEDEVAFTVEADLAAGDFSGTIPTAGLAPGSYRVWTRACLGDACGPAATAPVTFGGGPSPTPTPTPTESPAPKTTEVAFTAGSATSGQHTDPTLFEAQVTDSDGDPIGGATLTFTLTGEESSRDFTATTDPDGIASVTPTLNEKPGPHQLTVRFAGDDDHAGDADTVSFVVDKEDTALELSVHGEDDDKTLRARLSDLDSASEGVAGRTIDFYSDGELIGSVATGTDGGATLAVPPGHRGNNRTYEAVFEGDDFYLESSDEKAGKGGKDGDGGNDGDGAESEGGRTYAGRMLLM